MQLSVALAAFALLVSSVTAGRHGNARSKFGRRESTHALPRARGVAPLVRRSIEVREVVSPKLFIISMVLFDGDCIIGCFLLCL